MKSKERYYFDQYDEYAIEMHHKLKPIREQVEALKDSILSEDLFEYLLDIGFKKRHISKVFAEHNLN